MMEGNTIGGVRVVSAYKEEGQEHGKGGIP